ncbi:MAG: glycosyltransferase family 2 protein [Lachnospiraceae bacterium]|nr:glycosyltransferase family 2 protein [Lachnospiraceae bacterium]
MAKTLYMVVPCYNEEAVLAETTKRLKDKYISLLKEGLISIKSKVVYVNDGSKDRTWEIITNIHKEDKMFRGICLSRNRGHQNAVLAGLMTVKDEADMVITMDADLQDDIDAIDEMVKQFNNGYDIVYGVRNSRKTDTFFKRFTAQTYYKLLLTLGVDIVYNHADFRLMSKRAINEMENFKEVNLFLRGIVPMVGFPSTNVYYERHERFAGESKYPLKKMLHFAFDGVTSLSIKPIRFITMLGLIIFMLSLGMLIYSIVIHFVGDSAWGWSSLMTSVWALGGLQLLAIGIIGEYIGKIYLESKARPRFIIQEYLKDE